MKPLCSSWQKRTWNTYSKMITMQHEEVRKFLRLVSVKLKNYLEVQSLEKESLKKENKNRKKSFQRTLYSFIFIVLSLAY